MVTPAASPLGTLQDFWNQRYLQEGFAYGSEPNDFLPEQAAALIPGRALCLAEGEGRNAVHLARFGHQVIAQDISSVGLEKARELAAEHGVAIGTLCCDLADWHPEPASLDLVVAIWRHLPPTLILGGSAPCQLELATGTPQAISAAASTFPSHESTRPICPAGLWCWSARAATGAPWVLSKLLEQGASPSRLGSARRGAQLAADLLPGEQAQGGAPSP
jgi:hypothetical protein